MQAVVDLALWLAATVGADAEIVEAAAWLHDIRKGHANHAAQGAKAAKRILADTDFPGAKIDAVADAIASTRASTVRRARRRWSRWRPPSCGTPTSCPSSACRRWPIT